MYQLIIHKKVIKFLDKHPELLSRFDKALDQLETGYWESLDLEFLSGKGDDFRLRIGKYRFLFTLQKEQLIIYCYKADSRGGAYK